MKNQKASVLLYAMQLAPQNGLFVEIGCIREDHEVATDGYSTVYMSKYCKNLDLRFVSVDNQEKNVVMANKVLEKEGLKPEVITEDGKKFLEYEDAISFLYLDSHRHPQYSYDQYINSELAEGAVVAIDDAQPYDDHELGKATQLVELFEVEGISWRLIPTEPGFSMVVAKFPRGKKHGMLS